jgi:hypothetical protein
MQLPPEASWLNMLMRPSCASLWDEQVLVVACTGLKLRGVPPLPLLVRHETGPLLLRVLARHKFTPQLFSPLVRDEFTPLPRDCSLSAAQ